MPCRCDHMEPTVREIELSKVAAILDEIVLGKYLNPKNWERGCHPDIYNAGASQEEADQLTAMLCRILGKIHREQHHRLRTLSPEAREWWAEHFRKDRQEGREPGSWLNR